MYDCQQSAKMVALQQDACKSTENQTAGGAALTQGYSVLGLTAAEGVARSLQGRIDQAEKVHGQAMRVADILQRHPEFHEFLEVLRSGLV